LSITGHVTLFAPGGKDVISVFSGLRREPDENRALPGYYAVSSGISLLTFRENLSVQSSKVKNPLKMEPISCHESSVRNRH